MGESGSGLCDADMTAIPPGLDSAESTDKKRGPRTPFAFSATFLVVLIVLDLVLVVL